MSEKIIDSGIKNQIHYVVLEQKQMKYKFAYISENIVYIDNLGRCWKYVGDERNGSQFISAFTCDNKKRLLKFATRIFDQVKELLTPQNITA